jgi:hypothetical protein
MLSISITIALCMNCKWITIIFESWNYAMKFHARASLLHYINHEHCYNVSFLWILLVSICFMSISCILCCIALVKFSPIHYCFRKGSCVNKMWGRGFANCAMCPKINLQGPSTWFYVASIHTHWNLHFL